MLRTLVALAVCLAPAPAFAQAEDGRVAAGCMSIYTTQSGLAEGDARADAQDRLRRSLRRLRLAAPDPQDGRALVGEEAAALRTRITAASDRQALFAELLAACDNWLDG